MPIVSSEITHNDDLGTGRRFVCEVHTDHTGKRHEHRYRAPLAHDVNAALAVWPAKLMGALVDDEKQNLKAYVIAGGDPTEFSADWLNIPQRRKATMRAMMRGDVHNVSAAASFVEALSDNAIDNLFNPTKRAAIRARQATILAAKTLVDADTALKQELE